jgi:ActR/RegA family two-component response regulator/ABC-type transporter Mla MlaB component
MNVSTGNTREERRKINEECYWCSVNATQVFKGVILNESATGVLVRIDRHLENGKKLYILSIPSGLDNLDQPTPDVLKNHPLTRSGTVVRQDGTNTFGIQFYGNHEDRPEYRRWFREKCTIALLTFPERSVFHLSGQLTLEAAALLQTLFTQQKKRVSEFLLSCYEVEDVATTAGTLFRSTLQECDQEGISITMIGGDQQSPCESINKSLVLKNGLLFTMGETYSLPAGQSTKAKETPAVTSNRKSDSEAKPSPEAKRDSVVLVAKGQSILNRLAMPFAKMDLQVFQTQKYLEAVDFIIAESPLFLVVDVDMDTCENLVMLNKIKEYKISHKPSLMVLGPNHIYGLVKEAMILPVAIYLTKPFTDRDYVNGITTIIQNMGIRYTAQSPSGT